MDCVSAFAALRRAHEYLVIHSPLDYEETGGNETFLKKLGLEHFDQVFNS